MLIAVVHAAVYLIENNDIKMPNAVKTIVAIGFAINHVDDGLVGRENNAAAFVFFLFG